MSALSSGRRSHLTWGLGPEEPICFPSSRGCRSSYSCTPGKVGVESLSQSRAERKGTKRHRRVLAERFSCTHQDVREVRDLRRRQIIVSASALRPRGAVERGVVRFPHIPAGRARGHGVVRRDRRSYRPSGAFQDSETGDSEVGPSSSRLHRTGIKLYYVCGRCSERSRAHNTSRAPTTRERGTPRLETR